MQTRRLAPRMMSEPGEVWINTSPSMSWFRPFPALGAGRIEATSNAGVCATQRRAANRKMTGRADRKKVMVPVRYYETSVRKVQEYGPGVWESVGGAGDSIADTCPFGCVRGQFDGDPVVAL